jgi:hypothetical protein
MYSWSRMFGSAGSSSRSYHVSRLSLLSATLSRRPVRSKSRHGLIPFRTTGKTACSAKTTTSSRERGKAVAGVVIPCSAQTRVNPCLLARERTTSTGGTAIRKPASSAAAFSATNRPPESSVAKRIGRSSPSARSSRNATASAAGVASRSSFQTSRR